MCNLHQKKSAEQYNTCVTALGVQVLKSEKRDINKQSHLWGQICITLLPEHDIFDPAAFEAIH